MQHLVLFTLAMLANTTLFVTAVVHLQNLALANKRA